mgnify:CR=1 FL=1
MMRATIKATARHGYRNLVGTLTVSLLVSLAAVPLLLMATVGTPLAVLAGLWGTCLALGVVLVGGLNFATAVAQRGVPIAVVPELRAGLAAPRTGLALGASTFAVLATCLALVGLTPAGLQSIAVGVAAFLLVDWYLVVGFAAPEIGNGEPLRRALRAGVDRLLSAPNAFAVFLTLSFACALFAGVTVVTVGLFLPGTLCLLAAHVTDAVDAER